MGITIRKAIENGDIELNKQVALALKLIEARYGSDYEFDSIKTIRELIAKLLNPQ